MFLWRATRAQLILYRLQCPCIPFHCQVMPNCSWIFAQVRSLRWPQRHSVRVSHLCPSISSWIRLTICCRIALLSGCSGWRLLAALLLHMQVLLAPSTVVESCALDQVLGRVALRSTCGAYLKMMLQPTCVWCGHALSWNVVCKSC